VSDLSIEGQLKREAARERARFVTTDTDHASIPANSLAAHTHIHHRRQDRRSNDDPALPMLPVYVRYPDLRRAGIVTSWVGLRRLIVNEKFPTGAMLAPKTRAWLLSEVRAWLDTRPTANPRQRMRHKRAIEPIDGEAT
jgi:predicted DNA-binding transcriptional regulator AlpA